MSEVVIRVVKEYQLVTVRISKPVQSRINRLKSRGQCLACEKKFVAGERVTRGDCATCYNGALHAIRKGKVTIDELIREGKMLEKKPRGRKPANKFTQELAQR